MTANCSAECPTQHMRRICSMAHISNTCNVPEALDMHIVTDSWVDSGECGLTEHTHISRSDRQSARLISKTSTTKQEMQTPGKILRSTRRSLATDAVSELARSILHPALWWHKKLKRAYGGTQTIGMCCTCATSCGELSSRIAPAVHYPERDAPLQHRQVAVLQNRGW